MFYNTYTINFPRCVQALIQFNVYDDVTLIFVIINVIFVYSWYAETFIYYSLMTRHPDTRNRDIKTLDLQIDRQKLFTQQTLNACPYVDV